MLPVYVRLCGFSQRYLHFTKIFEAEFVMISLFTIVLFSEKRIKSSDKGTVITDRSWMVQNQPIHNLIFGAILTQQLTSIDLQTQDLNFLISDFLV